MGVQFPVGASAHQRGNDFLGNLVHRFVRGQRGVMRIKFNPPKSSTTKRGKTAGTAAMLPKGSSRGAKHTPVILAAPPATNRYWRPGEGSPSAARLGPGKLALVLLPATVMRSTQK